MGGNAYILSLYSSLSRLQQRWVSGATTWLLSLITFALIYNNVETSILWGVPVILVAIITGSYARTWLRAHPPGLPSRDLYVTTTLLWACAILMAMIPSRDNSSSSLTGALAVLMIMMFIVRIIMGASNRKKQRNLGVYDSYRKQPSERALTQPDIHE